MTNLQKITYDLENAKRFVKSPIFERMFEQVSEIVKQSAEYLERRSPQDKARLSPRVVFYFEHETNRMTDRLVSISSWIMMLHGYTNGEGVSLNNHFKNYRDLCRIDSVDVLLAFMSIPASSLVIRSHCLYQRAYQIDQRLLSADLEQNQHIFSQQHNLIVNALSGKPDQPTAETLSS